VSSTAVCHPPLEIRYHCREEERRYQPPGLLWSRLNGVGETDADRITGAEPLRSMTSMAYLQPEVATRRRE
jgi:hypothetical protein